MDKKIIALSEVVQDGWPWVMCLGLFATSVPKSGWSGHVLIHSESIMSLCMLLLTSGFTLLTQCVSAPSLAWTWHAELSMRWHRLLIADLVQEMLSEVAESLTQQVLLKLLSTAEV